ncbi:ACP phosphodiesterase [Alkalinema pantanalense CENA528]|uniref:acyl carrier protein phosphodiesterase n=1 Tax=Alkalinema pantanalense TaxID=1620705 RepID=UPI003D6F74E7
MNYLAHLHLSDGSPESMIGNLLGDFRKGLCETQYSLAIRQGMTLHQQVDIFTDTHAIVRRSKQRIQPKFRRFAGIMLDVLYDHFLSKHWADYSQESLREFIDRAYGVLLTHQAILPPLLQRAVPVMVDQDWLYSYRDLAGVDLTLRRIARRFKRETPLAQAIGELQSHYPALEEDFQAFFPLLVQWVQEQPSGMVENPTDNVYLS